MAKRQKLVSRCTSGAFAVAAVLLAGAFPANAQTSRAPHAVEAAVLPLPEHLRAGATVVLQADDGTSTILRKGTNDMVCVDATTTDTFLAYCYTQTVYKVYQRAAALGKQLHTSDMDMGVADSIEAEIKRGKLTLPREPTVGFALMGPIHGYDRATNSVNGEIKSWQTIMMPFATGAALGLPEAPAKDMPWVMHPGMWMAHIMIEHADGQSDQQAFRDFLTQAKSNASAEKEKVAAFYRTTGAFWRAHWLDYSHHPENYADVMALYRADQALYPRAQDARDPERYRKDIEAFKQADSKNPPPNNAALFVGSSTIAKWKTADAFPGFSVINRGFGGSVLGDVLYFYKDVIGKYHPSAILLYCDNDVASGGDPDQAFEKVMQIYAQVRSDFPKVPFVFLSMKHAPNSAFAAPTVPAAIDRFNNLAKAAAKKDPGFRYFDFEAPVLDANGRVQPDLFQDGEHYNDQGYALLNPAVQKLLTSLHVGSR